MMYPKVGLPRSLLLGALLAAVVVVLTLAQPGITPTPVVASEMGDGTIGTAPQQAGVDYDVDNDWLIEVSNLAQLNAIRWDLNGDGIVDEGGDAAGYSRAFPNSIEGMGCPFRTIALAMNWSRTWTSTPTATERPTRATPTGTPAPAGSR